MTKITARLQRPFRLPPLNIHVDGKLYAIASEPWLLMGPSFAKLFTTRFTRDDVMLTRAQGLELDKQGQTTADFHGHKAVITVAA